MKYIDTEKLKVLLFELKENHKSHNGDFHEGVVFAVDEIEEGIDSLQHEQPNSIIQWNGNNLKEVIDFTGKSPRFREWFKSFEEFENYVHTHNDILKLFCKDGSHYEVPVGAWIVKTPDGYNLPSVAKYIQQKQQKVDIEKEIDSFVQGWNIDEFLGLVNDEGWSVTVGDIKNVARHFYELGLKARKGE